MKLLTDVPQFVFFAGNHRVHDRYATRLALIPLQPSEPVGIDHLLRLAGTANPEPASQPR